jgi:hypothetical protein
MCEKLCSPASIVRAPSIANWRTSRSWIVLPHYFELSNQPREALVSDLSLQLREAQNQSEQLQVEGWLGRSEIASKPRRTYFLLPALALLAHMPLECHLT